MQLKNNFNKVSHYILSKTYKALPVMFWNNWSRTFMEDPWQKKIHPQHTWLLKKVNKHNPMSILEVGCGFGRNLNYLINNGTKPEKLTGVDFSNTMINKAKRNIKNKKVNLTVGDVLTLNFKNNNFDLVFTHGLLMHIDKKKIGQAISELIRVSRKEIILIEQNYNGNNYTFVHDYKKLLKEHKVKIVEYKKDKKLGLDMIIIEKFN